MMEVREVVGVFVAVIYLAGLSVAVIYGDKTAKVLDSGFKGFGGLISKATLQG